jgi:hypothetical protein
LNEDFPAYHLCTAQTFHSNFTLRLKKKLVGFSHYGHFSAATYGSWHTNFSSSSSFHKYG